MLSRKRGWLLLLVVLLVGTVAACGGDDDSGSDDNTDNADNPTVATQGRQVVGPFSFEIPDELNHPTVFGEDGIWSVLYARQSYTLPPETDPDDLIHDFSEDPAFVADFREQPMIIFRGESLYEDGYMPDDVKIEDLEESVRETIDGEIGQENVNLETIRITTVNDISIVEAKGTATIEALGMSQTYWIHAFYGFKDGDIMVMAMSAPASQADTYKPMFENILNSLQHVGLPPADISIRGLTTYNFGVGTVDYPSNWQVSRRDYDYLTYLTISPRAFLLDELTDDKEYALEDLEYVRDDVPGLLTAFSQEPVIGLISGSANDPWLLDETTSDGLLERLIDDYDLEFDTIDFKETTSIEGGEQTRLIARLEGRVFEGEYQRRQDYVFWAQIRFQNQRVVLMAATIPASQYDDLQDYLNQIFDSLTVK